MTELFNGGFVKPAQIAVIGHIKATTVLYNGAVIQRQGSTVWYKLNPTENRWEAIDNHAEIEDNYQQELRNVQK